MIDLEVDWTMISFEPKKKEADAAKAAPASACPKCGRKLGRGGHFHVKACKGVK